MLPIVDDYFRFPVVNPTEMILHKSDALAGNLPISSPSFGTQDTAPEVQVPSPSLKTNAWIGVSVLSAFATILYAPVLGPLARQWWSDPNYGHGFFVPLFAAYLVWRSCEQWRAVPQRASNIGLPIMLFAIVLLILGTLGGELFTTRISLIFLIAGIIVFLTGWRVLRSVAFPVGYLFLMVPLPAIIYYQLTFPLQLWASRLGANGLVALGIHTVRQGNLLILPNCTLEVVEACSGVRSLLSLLAAVVAYGYLAESSIWKRCLLALSTIPIAIVSNGLRLVATGVLSFFYGPGVDSGIIHLTLGLFFFVLAFLSIILIHEFLRRHWRETMTPEHS